MSRDTKAKLWHSHGRASEEAHYSHIFFAVNGDVSVFFIHFDFLPGRFSL
jgi:hypothetical protein